MLKMVYDDYRRGFWTALKKNSSFTVWYVYVYLSMLALTRIRYTNIVIAVGFVPMGIGIMLACAYPNQMRKIMFLCPLTVNERKAYLKTAYWFRVLLPMSFSLIGSTAAMVLGYMQVFYFIEMNLLQFSYLLGINVYCLPESWKAVKADAGQWSMRMPYAYEFLNVFLKLVGLIGMCLLASLDLVGVDEGNDKIALTVFVIAEILLCAIALKIYYKPVMERGISYEGCHPVKPDQ